MAGDRLEDSDIAATTAKLAPKALKTVAVMHMGLQQHEVEQFEDEFDKDQFKRKMIVVWRNKDINNNKPKLANILHNSGIASDKVIRDDLGNYQFTPIPFPNPTNEPTLKHSELGRLVKGITIQDMKSLAVGPLGFTEVNVTNIEAENKNDTWSVIFELFVKWSNKSGSNRQKLIEILKKSGKIQQDLILEILGDGGVPQTAAGTETGPTETPSTGTSSLAGACSQPTPDADTRTHAVSYNETSTGSGTGTGPSGASGGVCGSSQPSKGEDLTSARLLKLCGHITSESDLRNLATIGLEIEEHKVNKELKNKSDDITMAAHAVLTSWKKTQINGQEAYLKMCDGLGHKDVGMINLFSHVLK